MNERPIDELILLITISFFAIVWVIGGLIISSLIFYRQFFKKKTFTVIEIICSPILIFPLLSFGVIFGWFHKDELIEEDWIDLKKFLYYLALSSPIIMLTTLWVLT